jgi:hypothetical protein
VVAHAQLDDRVEMTLGSAPRLAGRDVEPVHLGERGQDAGPQVAVDATHIHALGRVDAPQHAGHHWR